MHQEWGGVSTVFICGASVLFEDNQASYLVLQGCVPFQASYDLVLQYTPAMPHFLLGITSTHSQS